MKRIMCGDRVRSRGERAPPHAVEASAAGLGRPRRERRPPYFFWARLLGCSGAELEGYFLTACAGLARGGGLPISACETGDCEQRVGRPWCSPATASHFCARRSRPCSQLA